MFKVITLLIACGSILCAQVPNHLTFREIFTPDVSLDYELEDQGKKIGGIHARESWNPHFDFYDADDQFDGSAIGHSLEFYVSDSAGNPVGTVRNEWNIIPTFTILSPIGEELATATMDLFKTTFIVEDYKIKTTLAKLKRGYYQPTDLWKITIVDGRAIDLRLYMVIMACQSIRDFIDREAMGNTFASIPSNTDFEKITKYLEETIDKGEDPIELLETSNLPQDEQYALKLILHHLKNESPE